LIYETDATEQKVAYSHSITIT